GWRSCCSLSTSIFRMTRNGSPEKSADAANGNLETDRTTDFAVRSPENNWLLREIRALAFTDRHPEALPPIRGSLSYMRGPPRRFPFCPRPFFCPRSFRPDVANPG